MRPMKWVPLVACVAMLGGLLLAAPVFAGDEDPGSSPAAFSAKWTMSPSGNEAWLHTPTRFQWARTLSATRYKLVFSRYDKKSGTYVTQKKLWVIQPSSGDPSWNPGTDILPAGKYRWTVTYYWTTMRGTSSTEFFQIKTPTYMLIDLSGGPTATRYPVSYLSAVPFGGWTDLYKTTVMVLRKIPAGTFTMGSPGGELGRESDETPHTVTLTKPFYIGVFEVTQRQWDLVEGFHGSVFSNTLYTATRPVDYWAYLTVRENFFNWGDLTVGWPQISAPHPNSFMGKLSAKLRPMTLDLPTEAQWEYACRAGTTTALNNGKNLTSAWGACPNMDQVGRYFQNGGYTFDYTCDTSHGTAKVGSYQPNAWGLYDMHGNVAEFCLDWYGPYTVAATDPKGPASGTDRVMRGGGWSLLGNGCRSANRSKEFDIYGLNGMPGFRVARFLP